MTCQRSQSWDGEVQNFNSSLLDSHLFRKEPVMCLATFALASGKKSHRSPLWRLRLKAKPWKTEWRETERIGSTVTSSEVLDQAPPE